MFSMMGGKGKTSAAVIMLCALVAPFVFFMEHPWVAIIIVSIIVAIIVLCFVAQKRQEDAAFFGANIDAVDRMSGSEFENFVAMALRKTGYTDVHTTKASGDYGVDILATMNGVKYAIQCKRYSRNVGIKPIQEVHSGAAMYGATACMVVTNVYFTDNGRTLARKLGVRLVDRDGLKNMMRSAAKY